MSGTLPGVECARRRKASHHHPIPPNPSPRPSGRRLYSLSGDSDADGGSYLDENALRARRSLEGKLRNLHPPNSKRRWNGMFSWVSGSGPTTNRRSEPTVVSAANNGFCLTAVSDRLSSETEVCPVCLDVFHLHQTVMHLPCLHRYHPECLRPWLSAHSDCPYCRTHVSVRSVEG
ncbi:E3 ubiquitin-protein ligase RING1-like [Nymphaea thermarum]|nr:E3 ubiquitin-protein ligase RING1-like [Nymphaea thermarum]